MRANHERESETAQQETGRIEAFSDGVFAIAATLLVLDIHVPQVEGDWLALLGALANQWPTYLAYLVSFVFILVMWINHHNLFKLIRRSDHNLLILNGVLLLFITLVPFPTSLLADYLQKDSAGRAAAVVLNLFFVVIATAFNALWRYAARKGRLLAADVDPEAVAQISARYRFGWLFYIICALLGVVSPLASLALNGLGALYFALPARAHPVVQA